jgi:organic hydroperoxide reductase OsmC/OhrA
MKTLYTAEATATGGRNGHVKSSNEILDLQVRMPKALVLTMTYKSEMFLQQDMQLVLIVL